MIKNNILSTALVVALVIGFQTEASATVYTADTNLSDFTAGVSEYATFLSAGTFYTNDILMGNAPTTATIEAGKRVVGDGNTNPIIVSFSSAVSNIRVFANMDHLGAAFDGYQYSILGSNDNETFTPLFDALTANGSGEPFTLGSFTGTAPTTVNNIVTGSVFNGQQTGYIADFSFSNAYKYYEFGASTLAIGMGNADQELSAVATVAVPEPETYGMMLVGIGMLGFMVRRRNNNQV